MALVKKSSNSNRTLIIFAVFILVAGLGYVLVQQVFLGSADVTNQGLVNRTRPVITNYGESILNDSRYSTLRSFGQPININSIPSGQTNPFQ